jgi:hypothetical protein
MQPRPTASLDNRGPEALPARMPSRTGGQQPAERGRGLAAPRLAIAVPSSRPLCPHTVSLAAEGGHWRQRTGGTCDGRGAGLVVRLAADGTGGSEILSNRACSDV